MIKNKIRKPKKLIVIFVCFLIFLSAGIATGAFDKIINYSKAFIYCQGTLDNSRAAKK